MHEISLIYGIIGTVLHFKEKEKMEDITEVKVVLGQLQQINVEMFKGLLDQITKNHEILSSTRFLMRSEPPLLQCNKCNESWNPNKNKLNKKRKECIHFIPETSRIFYKCPSCGSKDFSIQKGRGVYIDYIKGMKE